MKSFAKAHQRGAVVLDLLAKSADQHLGHEVDRIRALGLFEHCARVLNDATAHVKQLTVLGHLLLMALARAHTLERLHAPTSVSGAIGKSLDGNVFAETADQAGDDADHVPQQGAIGRVVDVGFDDGRIDP